MELAGLACAQTLAKAFPKEEYKRVLVITGPGNQVSDSQNFLDVLGKSLGF
jgi:NAD(P)H-hydrate epimerase